MTGGGCIRDNVHWWAMATMSGDGCLVEMAGFQAGIASSGGILIHPGQQELMQWKRFSAGKASSCLPS